MSGGMIVNTVKFVFPPGAPRPAWNEIARFLKELDSNEMDMETVYKMGAERALCIKYKNEAAMKESLLRNPGIVKFHYSSGKQVELRMLTAGIDIRYVRVFDVPPELSDEDLSAALRSYGKIERMVREKFAADLGLGHLYNGVRGVYMEVDDAIPPSLDISQWKARIYYDGLKEKCFSCQKEGHRKIACPSEKVKSKVATYAGIVESGAAALSKETVIDEDIIEIVEDEVLEREMRTEIDKEMESTSKVAMENDDLTEKSEEERLNDEINKAAEQLGLENFRENIAKLSELIEELPNPGKDQATQRRAQFAASGSTELRPKKAARKNYH